MVVDVAYGGNFYAIVEPQTVFRDMADFTAGELIGFSPKLRSALNEKYEFVHSRASAIRGLSHILWTGAPRHEEAHARNAVFLWRQGDRPHPLWHRHLARMAQLAAKDAWASATTSSTRASSAPVPGPGGGGGRGGGPPRDRAVDRRLGRARPASTRSSSTTGTPSPTASSWCDQARPSSLSACATPGRAFAAAMKRAMLGKADMSSFIAFAQRRTVKDVGVGPP